LASFQNLFDKNQRDLAASVALDSTTRKSACACADDQTRCARLVPGATASDFSAEQATNTAAENCAGRT